MQTGPSTAPRPAPPTMSALFEPEPVQWGLRGDPEVWAAMRDLLAPVAVPDGDEAVRTLLREAFRDVVGVTPDTEREWVFREELDRGGMSGGRVHLPTWRGRLMPLLVSRSAKAAAGRGWAEDADDAALGRAWPASAGS